MDRRDHAAPPDDGHQGSYTVPSDVIVPGREPPGADHQLGRPEPRLHTDPPIAESKTPPRGIHVGALLAGVGAAILLGVIVLFTFMTSMP
jgi:hypothetical protein